MVPHASVGQKPLYGSHSSCCTAGGQMQDIHKYGESILYLGWRKEENSQKFPILTTVF